MNKKELENKLETLADEAQLYGHNVPAGIIYALIGAMKGNDESKLGLHIVEFTNNEIKRLTAVDIEKAV